MSTRWIAVQYVGDTLRLPIVDEFSTDKPFGSSELEREVRRIVVNPFSDSPQTFVPESENAKLRELADAVKEFVEDTHCEDCPYRRDCDDNNSIFCANDFSYHAFAAMRELGVETE